MKGLVDAFWRAAAYCLHPRVILLSLAPVLIAGGLVAALGWWFGADVVAGLRSWLDTWSATALVLDWFESLGFVGVRMWLAPLRLVVAAVPVMVVLALLMVAMLMTPAIVSLVASRRFPELERRQGGNAFQTAAWSLWHTVLAVLALLISLPLWLVPPLALVLPPLIWGWLTYRVFAYEVLALHATAAERRELLRAHRGPLLAMGVVAGYMGAAPTLLWAFGAATFVLAPLLLVLSMWLYTLVFAFAGAWFAHYALAALQEHRHWPQELPPGAVDEAALPPSLAPPEAPEDPAVQTERS